MFILEWVGNPKYTPHSKCLFEAFFMIICNLVLVICIFCRLSVFRDDGQACVLHFSHKRGRNVFSF